MSDATLLLAKWVCPMGRPPIRNGVVAIVSGRIAAVDDANIRKRFAAAEMVDYGDAALLPGLINPHTHLELTNRPRGEFDGDIVAWLLRQRPLAVLTPQQHQGEVEAAARAGIAQCLKFGVTCVGDISQQPQWTRPILAGSPISGTSFGEVLGLGRLRERTFAMRERAVRSGIATDRVRRGISPHAPYTLEWETLRGCATDACINQLPTAIHLSEFQQEREFLLHESGAFREMWERTQLWDDQVHLSQDGPIDLARRAELLGRSSILAHVNYAGDSEIATLAGGGASVVFCPRTHAYFRHPPHRWRDMLAAGVNVAVGTDSCASSPDLNIVDDLRLLLRQNPAVPIGLLWNLVTTRAAAALDREEVGSLAAGKMADVVVFDVKSDEPLREILEDERAVPREVWIGGERVNG